MPDDSASLLDRFQRGDPTAAAAIVHRYTQRLVTLAQSRLAPMLARCFDAEDVVQSAYHSFFFHAAQGEFTAAADGDLWPLLATITLRKLSRRAKHHRAARRNVARELPNVEKDFDLLSQIASHEPSPADVVATTEELIWLLDYLSPAQRRSVILRLQGHTIEQIGEELHRSERTIRRHLVDAETLLAERWKSFEEAPAPPDNPVAKLLQSRNAEFRLRHSDFRLHNLLAAGGIGKVYRATHRPTGQIVAIKSLRKQLLTRPAIVEQFLAEAQIVAQLDHPNIVQTHGLGRLPGGGLFIALDYIDGPDLARMLATNPPSLDRVVEITIAVARAIQHAHERGVIHRDLKPANILLDAAGNVFVTDFGFAALQPADAKIGQIQPQKNAAASAPILGTHGFMAPEQIDPSLGPLGPHTDVFGLGALLQSLVAASQKPPSTPIPSAIRDIIAKCTAADWQARFPTAVAVADALDAVAQSSAKSR